MITKTIINGNSTLKSDDVFLSIYILMFYYKTVFILRLKIKIIPDIRICGLAPSSVAFSGIGNFESYLMQNQWKINPCRTLKESFVFIKVISVEAGTEIIRIFRIFPFSHASCRVECWQKKYMLDLTVYI